MKKSSNPLLELLAGMALFAGGLFILFNIVTVSIGFMGIAIGNYNVGVGVVLVPFIIGIVWLFVNPDSFGAKILTVLGLLAIVAYIVVNIRITMKPTTMFTFVVVLVMVFGGLGLMARALFGNNNSNKDE